MKIRQIGQFQGNFQETCIGLVTGSTWNFKISRRVFSLTQCIAQEYHAHTHTHIHVLITCWSIQRSVCLCVCYEPRRLFDLNVQDVPCYFAYGAQSNRIRTPCSVYVRTQCYALLMLSNINGMTCITIKANGGKWEMRWSGHKSVVARAEMAEPHLSNWDGKQCDWLSYGICWHQSEPMHSRYRSKGSISDNIDQLCPQSKLCQLGCWLASMNRTHAEYYCKTY